MSVWQRAYGVLLVLWLGSLWSLALWVAPTLFYLQADRHLAGVLAARLFSIETYAGLLVAALSFLIPHRRRLAPLYAAAALLALNEWAVKPLMSRAHDAGAAFGLGFGAWHGIAALLYLAACLCALGFSWKSGGVS